MRSLAHGTYYTHTPRHGATIYQFLAFLGLNMKLNSFLLIFLVLCGRGAWGQEEEDPVPVGLSGGGQIVELRQLFCSRASASDEFGFSVSISGDTALVGGVLDEGLCPRCYV
jgi:hypothetical protein